MQPDEKLFTRRDVLGLIGATAAAPFLACATGESAAGSPGPPCIVRPEQTEGPFFVDERPDGNHDEPAHREVEDHRDLGAPRAAEDLGRDADERQPPDGTEQAPPPRPSERAERERRVGAGDEQKNSAVF